MSNIKLWTRNFITLVGANGLLFAGFHFLLPTLPLYAASIGASGAEIGIITGIFGFSAYLFVYSQMQVYVNLVKRNVYI